MADTNEIPPRPVRVKIAASAECDDRAVARYYRDPERVRPALRAAIRRALPALGLRDPHPVTP